MSYKPHPTIEGAYYVIHRPNGKGGKQKYELASSLNKAIELDNKLKAQKFKPAPQIHPKIKEAVPDYLLWVEDKQSPTTYSNKVARFKHIVEFFGEYRVKEIDQVKLDAYSRLHTRSIYRIDQANLMALIKWMQKRKLAPLLDYRPEAVSIQPKVKPIPSPADLMLFIDALEEEDHRMIMTLILMTGLRWSEAAGLKIEGINLKTGVARINEVVDAQEDVVLLPPVILQWIKGLNRIGGYVFKGRFPDTHTARIDHALRKAAKKVGFKVNPHLLRHASGTFVYQQTQDIYAVQHHLRHSRVTTSQIYTRYSVDQKRRTMGAVIDFITHGCNSKAKPKPANKPVHG